MEKVIQCKDLSKSYKSTRVLENIRFVVRKGEIFGYLGPNGSGKTTTLRLLLGLIQPDKGEIRLWGENIFHHQTNDRVIREKIGFVLENPGHFIYSTAIRNLEYYAKIYRVFHAEQKIKQWMSELGLWSRRHHPVETFSRGMKQKLAFIRCFLADPELIILDEPTTGLDPTSQKIIKDYLQEKVQSDQLTVLFSSHNLSEIQEICHRVALINQGKLIFCDTLENLQQKYLRTCIQVTLAEGEQIATFIEQVSSLTYVSSCRQKTGHLLVELQASEHLQELLSWFQTESWAIVEFKRYTLSLSEIYEQEVTHHEIDPQ